MNRLVKCFALTIALTLIISLTLTADTIDMELIGLPEITSEVLESSDEITSLRFHTGGIELHAVPGLEGYEVEIPGEGHITSEGHPSLPVISRLVAVPARAKVNLRFVYEQPEVIRNIKVLPAASSHLRDLPNGEIPQPDMAVYEIDECYPSEIAQISGPAIMRDLRLIRVSVYPVRYNPVKEEILLYHDIEVTLEYQPGGVKNLLESNPVKVSRSFADIYASKVINFAHLDLEVDSEWGTLLIICQDNPSTLSLIQPLVNWKNRRGISTVVATLTQTGSSAGSIHDYLVNAYNTMEPQLEYLILIGDTESSISVPASNSTGDHWYSRLDGGDVLADIAVGRFSCSNTTQLMTEVNKVVSYESTPYMGETAWYKKGAVVAGSSLSGISSIMVNQAIRWKALQNGYIEVDSLWYTMGGSVPTFTNNEINDGVGFYNYRGWLGMSGYSIGNINNLTNYHKLPFVTTITCGTGDIVGSGSDYTEEFFRVGTPSTPKGAIGAIGAATMSTHTRYNNCVDNGIWGAIFDYDIFQMGDALVSGKLDLYLSFPNNIGNVENYSDWINLIGDPSCQMWTDIPALITVDYPDTIPAGTTSLEITITKTASGNPLPEADVCLYGVNINLFGITDETGFVHFNLPALGEETFQVTCSKHDYKPHLGHVDVIVDEIFVGYDSTAIDDDNTGQSSGNDDSQINPGETIELGLALKNFGSSITAESPIAYLRCGHPYVTILDSTETYSNLAPGGVSALTYGMTFTVSQSAPHNFELPFTLHVESAQGEWDTYLPLIVSAPEMTYQTYTVEDPNGRLDPGDYAPMTVSVMNTGDLTGENITGFLTCGNSMIEINQNNVSYGSIAPGASAAGEGFMIEVSPLIMQGIMAPFDLYLSGGNGFIDTVSFEAVVGTVGDGDPFGPDEYGYYCIDNTDTSYLGYPVYNWIEIDPNYGGIGQLIPLSDFGDEQDDSRQMPMPFTFTYYGQSFDVITICSNGFAAMGELAYFTHFRNWYIPSTLGPPSLLAAFWDDLYLPSNPDGRVYSYYDEPNHKFIVEWSRVKSRGSGYPTETFEIILFDPAHHPTPTGDGKILYQYHTVSDVPANNSWDNDYATVGLESPDDLTGLQYSYWHHLSPGAADLVNGRAILFTTQTPINLSPPAIVHTPIENVTTPQNSYYVFARITSYTVLNDQELKIYWSLLPQGPFTEERLYPNNIGMPEEYFGAIPAVNPGNVVYYYLYAEDIAGAYSYLPAGAPNDLLMFLVGPQVELVFDDVELETGWTLGVPGDDATSGIWVREDPVESIADNGNVVQPENDHTPDPGHICFVTGNADSGAIAGTNDVDGGKTTLVTPVYDLSGHNIIYINYWYWYSNDQGNNPGQDEWEVMLSNDGGGDWITVEETTSSVEAWTYNQFLLQDYLPATSQVQLRFIASDYSPGSLVEACVDDFVIVGLDTTWSSGLSPGEFAPVNDIRLEFEEGRLVLKWEPIPGIAKYRIIRSDNPYFDLSEGIIECETTQPQLELTNPSEKMFFRVVAVP